MASPLRPAIWSKNDLPENLSHQSFPLSLELPWPDGIPGAHLSHAHARGARAPHRPALRPPRESHPLSETRPADREASRPGRAAHSWSALPSALTHPPDLLHRLPCFHSPQGPFPADPKEGGPTLWVKDATPKESWGAAWLMCGLVAS